MKYTNLPIYQSTATHKGHIHLRRRVLCHEKWYKTCLFSSTLKNKLQFKTSQSKIDLVRSRYVCSLQLSLNGIMSLTYISVLVSVRYIMLPHRMMYYISNVLKSFRFRYALNAMLSVFEHVCFSNVFVLLFFFFFLNFIFKRQLGR